MPMLERPVVSGEGASPVPSMIPTSVDDPNELLILFDIVDIAKAKAFCASDDLKSAMQSAGVIDKPDTYFLDDEG